MTNKRDKLNDWDNLDMKLLNAHANLDNGGRLLQNLCIKTNNILLVDDHICPPLISLLVG